MPSNWIDFRSLRHGVSMETLLDHYGVQLRRVHPNALRGKCPLPDHTSKSAYTFSVQTKKNIWSCKSESCRAARGGRSGGNALDFVVAMEHCSLREAASKIREWFPESGEGEFRRDQSNEFELPFRQKETQIANPPLRFLLRGIDPHHPYLRERGITAETASTFGVGFYAHPGLMQGRIVIPVHDSRGYLVAYAGRAVDGSEPKYRFPKGFRKSLELFNVHRVIPTRELILVEGFFDTMNVHQAGFQNVAALMGSTLSSTQQSMIVSRFDQVTLMLDGDTAGREATARIAAQFAGVIQVAVVSLPEESQPDQLPSQAIKRLLGQQQRSPGPS